MCGCRASRSAKEVIGLMDETNNRGTVLPLEKENLMIMISQLKNIPNTMVGFRASQEVTKEDFDAIVLPAVAELVGRTDELNYLLVLDTPLKNFTIGAWIKDGLLGLNNLTKWNRVAIVSDSESLNTFTDLFGKVMPGEFKGYAPEKLNDAVDWVSGQQKPVFQEEGDAKD